MNKDGLGNLPHGDEGEPNPEDENPEDELTTDEFIAEIFGEWNENGVPIQFKKESLTAIRGLTDAILKLAKAYRKGEGEPA